MRERLSTHDLGVWLALWGGGFAVSLLLACAGVSFHRSDEAFVLLVLRDVAFSIIAYFLWTRLRPHNAGRTAVGLTLDRLFLIAAAAFTVWYWVVALRTQPDAGDSPLAFHHLQLRMPIRLLCFVVFQQSINTYFLLDATRRRLGDLRGLALTVTLFSSSHLGAYLLGVPFAWSLLLTAASALGMTLWGVLRLKCGVRWAPICIHYLFYLVATLRYASG